MHCIRDFASDIHHCISYPISFEPCLPDYPKHQLSIEPLPAPRGNSLVIEVGGDLTAIHTALFQPKNAVYQGLVGRIKVDQGQRLGLNGNPKTEVVFRRPLKLRKGKSEITPP